MHEVIKQALRSAHNFAWQQRHEYVTVEHLLMMMCREMSENIYWQHADKVEADLMAYIVANNPALCGETIKMLGCTATLGLKRVVSRMQELVQQDSEAGKELIMLLAFCVEKNSFAAYTLHKYGIAQALRRYFMSLEARGCHAKMS